MKRILGTAVAVVLATAAGLTAPAAASGAVPSNVVTSSEFFQVTQGNSIGFVRSVFGHDGKVVNRVNNPGTASDGLLIQFPTYASNGRVEVSFSRRPSGTWFLDTKRAVWGNQVRRTRDKATESEFYRVKPGNSIAFARSTFGSAGTIMEYMDSPGTANDEVIVQWPTPSPEGELWLEFRRSSAGTWKVRTRVVGWGVTARRAGDVATDIEAATIAPGNSLDYVRRAFGTAGTVLAYTDETGNAYDGLLVAWPTSSASGEVSVHFDKRSSGAWKVDRLDDGQADWR